MLIIVDKKIPAEAREKLAAYGSLLELATEGIVYPAISGHPDIFICQTPQTLIISPSLPEKYVQIIKDSGIQFIQGNPVITPPPTPSPDYAPTPTPSPKREGESRITHPASRIQHPASRIQYPASIHYNAAVSNHYLIHRLEYTDPVILENCHTLKKIPVKQGYTRCNLLLLKDDHYITSDPGIHRNLERAGLEGILVSPEGIKLPGFPNGFIGGTAGIFNDTVYFIGSLSKFPEGDSVRTFLEKLDYRIVELYEGPLLDGGGILFNEE
jgi:hypothetical protein